MKVNLKVLKQIFAEMNMIIQKILDYGAGEEFILHKIQWLHTNMHIY